MVYSVGSISIKISNYYINIPLATSTDLGKNSVDVESTNRYLFVTSSWTRR